MKIFGRPVGKEKRELEAAARLQREWEEKLAVASKKEVRQWYKEIEDHTLKVPYEIKKLIRAKYKEITTPLYSGSYTSPKEREIERIKLRIRYLESEIRELENSPVGTVWRTGQYLNSRRSPDQNERISSAIAVRRAEIRQLESDLKYHFY